MLPVLHVLAIGLQHAGARARLRKDFPQHRQIQPQCRPQPKPFRKRGGVGIHHHVDQRLYLRRLAGRPDVTQRTAQFFQNGFGALEHFRFAAAHQI